MRRLSSELDLSRTGVHRILHDIGEFSYKIQVLQKLSPNDFFSVSNSVKGLSHNSMRMTLACPDGGGQMSATYNWIDKLTSKTSDSEGGRNQTNMMSALYTTRESQSGVLYRLMPS